GTRCPSSTSTNAWPSSRTSARSAGSRTSPRRWARRPSWACSSRRTCPTACRSPVSPGRRARRRRSATTPSPTSNRTGCTTPHSPDMYFTDRGIEDLDERRGDEQVTLGWLAERLRDFVGLIPEFETAVERLATWLARFDDDEEVD